VSTRTTAGKIEALVEQITELEVLGRQVQGNDEPPASLAAIQLDTNYRSWYASALAVLPDDLMNSFRSEFEGSFFKNRIKHFLTAPRERSSFYDSLDENSIRTLKVSPWQYPFEDTFRNPIASQRQILLEALARYGVSSIMLESLQLLEQITRRLPLSFAVLGKPIQKRPGIVITDEYDVQRFLHAAAVLHFEEVEDEDPTPKMAGGSSRLDFLLKRERIAIETKMLGKNLTLSKLRDDLAKDIIYFRRHPDADSLFIFVYDPTRKILNSSGFERDLHSDSDVFPVRVVVASLGVTDRGHHEQRITSQARVCPQESTADILPNSRRPCRR
jgi:hypothetical protein